MAKICLDLQQDETVFIYKDHLENNNEYDGYSQGLCGANYDMKIPKT
jgi:hypothetical protein